MKTRGKIEILRWFFCIVVSVYVLCGLGSVQAGPGLMDTRLDTGKTTGKGRSWDPQMSSDKRGHIYVVWRDDRNGKFDIYFHYSKDYGVTWQTNDVRIDTGDEPGANDSYDPRISSDENGHVYVTWVDYRNEKPGIYFNYSSDYGVTWKTNDIRLNSGEEPGTNRSHDPQISSDENGHVYVTWESGQKRGYSSTDIYLNYSDDYGKTWQTSDIRLNTGEEPGANSSYDPQISSDNEGHVYVTWVDHRNKTCDFYSRDSDIYFNYSDDYGETWQTGDIRLNTGDGAGAHSSHDPQISSDEDGHVYVVWEDGRNGEYKNDIYFNYSEDYGETWQTSDIRLDTGDAPGANSSHDPQISSDDSGHVYVVWGDNRNGEYRGDIYFNYSGDYGVTWQTNDIRLDTGDTPGAHSSYASQIRSNDDGHVYVVWGDDRDGSSDIYLNYSEDYGATWQTIDTKLDTGDVSGAHSSGAPQIVCDRNGHVCVIWRDDRNGFSDIYLNYSEDYGVMWQLSDVKLDTDTPTVTGLGYSGDVRTSSDDTGHVYVTWEDYRDGRSNIYFNYSEDYGVTWQASDIRLTTGEAPSSKSSYDPRISSDDNGHVYVTWEGSRDGRYHIYFKYSEDYGVTWQSGDTRLNTGANYLKSSQISSDEKGHVYVTWEDYRDSNPDIYFNYSNDYGVTWQANDIRLDTGDGPGAHSSYAPQISSDDNGHVYVTWEGCSNGNFGCSSRLPYDYNPFPPTFIDYSSDIHFNYSEDYGVTWQASDIRVDTDDSPGEKLSFAPKISSDNNGHVYVVWGDLRNENSYSYSSDPTIRFNYSDDHGVTWQINETKLDIPGASSFFYYNPRITSDANGHLYVWMDSYGSSDIYFYYSDDHGDTWKRRDTGLNTEAREMFNSSISYDDRGYLYMTWVVDQNEGGDIYFNYSKDFGVTWQTNDIRLDTGDEPGANISYSPLITSDGKRHAYVIWRDRRNAQYGYNTIYFNYFFVDEIINLNDSVSVNSIESSYYWTLDTTVCPNGFVGKFGFDVEIKNRSYELLSDLVVQVKELTGENIVLIEDGGSGSEGSTITIIETGDYSDGELSPGETVIVPFVICLKRWKPFNLFIDVLGKRSW